MSRWPGGRTLLRYWNHGDLGRWLISGVLLIVGLGRMGMISTSGTPTTVPGIVYGTVLLACGMAMIVTGYGRRSRLTGRVVAGLSACVLAGLAADVIAGQGSMTSAWMLLWVAGGAALEALTNHGC